MTDPDITHQTQRASNALAARLRPWATGMQLPEAFADEFMQALIEEGWRPVRLLATPQPHDPGNGLETTRRGYHAARAGLGLPLIDPDCRDGKCGSCIGGPCEHDCHALATRTHKDT